MVRDASPGPGVAHFPKSLCTLVSAPRKVDIYYNFPPTAFLAQHAYSSAQHGGVRSPCLERSCAVWTLVLHCLKMGLGVEPGRASLRTGVTISPKITDPELKIVRQAHH